MWCVYFVYFLFVVFKRGKTQNEKINKLGVFSSRTVQLSLVFYRSENPLLNSDLSARPGFTRKGCVLIYDITVVMEILRHCVVIDGLNRNLLRCLLEAVLQVRGGVVVGDAVGDAVAVGVKSVESGVHLIFDGWLAL